ncbi:MAG TPA: hypothetical protein VH643_03330 [Gemmataceae bacterium]|jgi:hypothetical protein
MDTRAGTGYAASATTEGTSGEKTVTEAEWLACGEAVRLSSAIREQLSTRKVRLFLAVCFRSVWDSLPADCHRVIEVNERFAEGQASPKEMERACLACRGITTELAMGIIESLMERHPSFAPLTEVALEQSAKAEDNSPATRTGFALGHAHLFRDVVGNPFRPVSIGESWLRWNGGTIVQLAQSAYEERHLPAGTLDNGRLAVLADALEEAGCTDADILGHLRGPGPHVRGCWAVDLLLGKS